MKILDERVKALTNTHLEHDKIHLNNMEETREKMNDLNEEILEIRSLAEVCKTRDDINKAKRNSMPEMLAKLYGVIESARLAKKDSTK